MQNPEDGRLSNKKKGKREGELRVAQPQKDTRTIIARIPGCGDPLLSSGPAE